jgi:DNA polymerase V
MPSDPPGGLSRSPVPLAQEPPVRELATLSRVRAGFPSPAADDAGEGLDLNAYLVQHPAASYLFDVAGDSMIDLGILPGDKVVVDRSRTARHGDVVVAEVGDGYTLKQLFQRDGKIELRPGNAAYPVIVIGEGDALALWGVVTGLVRRYPPRG